MRSQPLSSDTPPQLRTKAPSQERAVTCSCSRDARAWAGSTGSTSRDTVLVEIASDRRGHAGSSTSVSSVRSRMGIPWGSGPERCAQKAAVRSRRTE